jgi:uncharacterized membrane protein
MTKNRLEAFSDGVFAVAITLLVLEIDVPEGDHLWHKLGDEWPSFASFLVSFWVIGIIWVNHHGVIDHLKRTDRGVLYLNLLVLMSVVLIPFATALMAAHLNTTEDENAAAAVYAISFVLMAISFGVLWEYITRHREKLGVELTDEEVRRRSLAFQIGNPFYAIAVGVAFISPAAVLVIIGALAVYYMVAGMRSPDAA